MAKKKKSSDMSAKRKAPKQLVKQSARRLAKAKLSKPLETVKPKGRAKAVKVVVKSAPPKKLSSDMLRLRNNLMQMFSELRNDIDHEVRGAGERDLTHVNDALDLASDTADGDLSLRLAESESTEAGEIKRAIEKIDNGTYGFCETCNKSIGVERLKFRTFATLCIKCQELSEIRKRAKEDEIDEDTENLENLEGLENMEDVDED